MKILRQILKFFIVGAVFLFLLLGFKLLYNNKQNNKFTELIKPNEAKADTPVGGIGGSGDNGGGACDGCEGSCGCDGSSGP